MGFDGCHYLVLKRFEKRNRETPRWVSLRKRLFSVGCLGPGFVLPSISSALGFGNCRLCWFFWAHKTLFLPFVVLLGAQEDFLESSDTALLLLISCALSTNTTMSNPAGLVRHYLEGGYYYDDSGVIYQPNNFPLLNTPGNEYTRVHALVMAHQTQRGEEARQAAALATIAFSPGGASGGVPGGILRTGTASPAGTFGLLANTAGSPHGVSFATNRSTPGSGSNHLQNALNAGAGFATHPSNVPGQNLLPALGAAAGSADSSLTDGAGDRDDAELRKYFGEIADEDARLVHLVKHYGEKCPRNAFWEANHQYRLRQRDALEERQSVGAFCAFLQAHPLAFQEHDPLRDFYATLSPYQERIWESWLGTLPKEMVYLMGPSADPWSMLKFDQKGDDLLAEYGPNTAKGDAFVRGGHMSASQRLICQLAQPSGAGAVIPNFRLRSWTGNGKFPNMGKFFCEAADRLDALQVVVGNDDRYGGEPMDTNRAVQIHMLRHARYTNQILQHLWWQSLEDNTPTKRVSKAQFKESIGAISAPVAWANNVTGGLEWDSTRDCFVPPRKRNRSGQRKSG